MQTMPEIKNLKREDVEVFWYKVGKVANVAGEPLFGNIPRFDFNILCLPHSSAEFERVFSVLNYIKTKLRNRLNIKACEALILSKDYLATNGGHCYSFDTTKPITANLNAPINVDDCNEIDDILSCFSTQKQ